MDLNFSTAVWVGLAILVVVSLVAIGFALYKLAKTFWLIRAADMPVSGKVTFWLAVAYTVLPVDLVPDPIYFDDAGVVLGTVAYVGHLARKHGLLDRMRARRSGAAAGPTPVTGRTREAGPTHEAGRTPVTGRDLDHR